MAAPKGHKGYKPKGSKSNKTIAWQNLGEFITEQGAERLKKILTESDDATFMKTYIQLIEYFKPKQSRTEVEKINDREQVLIIKRETINYPDWLTSSIVERESITEL